MARKGTYVIKVTQVRQELRKRNWTEVDFVVKVKRWRFEISLPTIQKMLDGRPVSRSVVQAVARTLYGAEFDWHGLVAAASTGEDAVQPDVVIVDKLSFPHHVPRAEQAEFFDRDDERAQLFRALKDGWPNVVCVIGFGGSGKTALIRDWLDRLQSMRFDGARRVLAYSFDFEGASVEEFFGEAFSEWFNDPQSNAGDWWKRGSLLAKHVQGQRTLLVLDALERVMEPTERAEGRVANGIASLLESLARDNPGLCVVTSRLKPVSLANNPPKQVGFVPIDALDEVRGAAFLASLGVRGTKDQRQHLARVFQGHALSLKLLAAYLTRKHNGDPTAAREVSLLDPGTVENPLRLILAQYEALVKGIKEDLLLLVSLFDSAVSIDDLERLRADVIPQLTDSIRTLQFEDIRLEYEDLSMLSMLSTNRKVTAIDCHPMIREYYRERLAGTRPDAWQHANEVLFARAISVAPDNVASEADLDVLYSAARHACRSGKYSEAWRDIFLPRIRQNVGTARKNYNLRVYGHFASDLVTLREFFKKPYSAPPDGLTDAELARLYMEVGCDLRAQGRLSNARLPLQESLRISETASDWVNACEAAGNLAELTVRQGRLAEARQYASRAAELARLTSDQGLQIVMMSVLGNVLHLAGETAESLGVYEQAERLQALDRERPELHGVEGFQLWDALLAAGRSEEVIARTDRAIRWTKPEEHLKLGLTQLSLGRAHLLATDGRKRDPEIARKAILEGIDHLDRAARAEYRPRAILAESELWRVSGGATLRRMPKKLDDAIELADSYGLQLSLIDLHLEQGRVYRQLNRVARADKHLSAARQLAEQYPYGLRKEELAPETSTRRRKSR